MLCAGGAKEELSGGVVVDQRFARGGRGGSRLLGLEGGELV